MLGADQLTPVSWGSLWTIEGLVAIGTLALAAVTVFLAWRTSKMASETADLAGLTEQEVALARTAIEADVRPVLIAVPPGEFVHPQNSNYEVRMPDRGTVRGNPDRAAVWVQDIDGWLFVSAPVRNEGAGIAFGLDASLHWQGREIPGEITSEQVPPKELSRASFGISPDDQPPDFAAVAGAGSVWVRVTYTDLAGNLWASRLKLEPTTPAANDWKVTGLEILGLGRIGR